MKKRASTLGVAALTAWFGAASMVALTAACDSDDDNGGAGGAAGGSGGSGGSPVAGTTGTAGAAGNAGTAGAGGTTALKDLVDTAVAAGTFTKLVAAVQAAELVTTLKGPGPFTVFAPSDAAFAKLPAGALDELLKPANKAQLQALLTYHVVAGKVLAADVVKLTKAKTVQGADVAISVAGSTVKVNDATVTATDVQASNGVIHVIDTVLMPPAATAAKDIVETAVAAGSFTKLVAAVQAAELVTTLKGPGPFTVFAPTDAAFAKLPAGALDDLLKPANKAQLQAVLTYHVVAGKVLAADVVKLTKAKTVQGADVTVAVSGNTVKINDATVVMTDIQASNGVIHVIDTVLMPPAATAANDIVDTAAAAGTFTKLVAAVQAAELVATLKGPGPFTVFAPTDAAFAKLPAGALDELLKPANKAKLQALLTYHVVAGKVLAADVVKLTTAKTVQGANVNITVTGTSVKVNDANVVTTDVAASNGVIHVIDTVLMPPAS